MGSNSSLTGSPLPEREPPVSQLRQYGWHGIQTGCLDGDRLSIATRNEPGDASHGSSRAVRTPPGLQIPYGASQAGNVDKPESGPVCSGRFPKSGGQQSGSPEERRPDRPTPRPQARQRPNPAGFRRPTQATA